MKESKLISELNQIKEQIVQVQMVIGWSMENINKFMVFMGTVIGIIDSIPLVRTLFRYAFVQKSKELAGALKNKSKETKPKDSKPEEIKEDK